MPRCRSVSHYWRPNTVGIVRKVTSIDFGNSASHLAVVRLFTSYRERRISLGWSSLVASVFEAWQEKTKKITMALHSAPTGLKRNK